MVVRKAILISLEESWNLFIDKLFPFESRIKKKPVKIDKTRWKRYRSRSFFYHDMQLLNDWLRSKHEKTPRLGGTDKTTTHTKRTIAFNIGNNDKKKKQTHKQLINIVLVGNPILNLRIQKIKKYIFSEINQIMN